MDKLAYDFMSPHGSRLSNAAEALGLWQQHRGAWDAKWGSALLYGTDGTLNAEMINRLVSQRDDRRVSLRE
jgi:hypothetical protein